MTYVSKGTDVEALEKMKVEFVGSGYAWAWSEACMLMNPHESFRSWESGLDSTDRKNFGRIIRLLNELDGLTSNNVRTRFFEEIRMMIMVYMGNSGYEIKPKTTTYTIKEAV